jgi:hypothetical protein
VCKAGLIWSASVLPKKRARRLFPYKSKGLRTLCALAHNFVHKKCEEAGSTGRAEAVRHAAKFFSAKISLIKIKGLPYGKLISHKFIHRNCGQVPSSIRDDIAMWKSFAAPAKFLRMAKYSLRIKDLSWGKGYCAHFYPQKVCRTLLAANPATSYIAQFVSLMFFYHPGVPFARHSSSRRLAHLAVADCLDHRIGPDRRTPDLPAP